MVHTVIAFLSLFPGKGHGSWRSCYASCSSALQCKYGTLKLRSEFAEAVFFQCKVCYCGSTTECLLNLEVVNIFLLPVALFIQRLPNALKELEELREFYDPDTVQLMKWIK